MLQYDCCASLGACDSEIRIRRHSAIWYTKIAERLDSLETTKQQKEIVYVVSRLVGICISNFADAFNLLLVENTACRTTLIRHNSTSTLKLQDGSHSQPIEAYGSQQEQTNFLTTIKSQFQYDNGFETDTSLLPLPRRTKYHGRNEP